MASVVWVLVAALLLGLGAVLAVLAPIQLKINGELRGEASGAWLLAFAIGLGPVVVGCAGARGVRSELSLYVFGRRVARRALIEAQRSRPSGTARKSRSRARVLGVPLHRIDPVEAAVYLWNEKRRIRVVRSELDLAYGFVDVALTGRLVGAISVLSALLPPDVAVRQRPRWDGADGFELKGDGLIRVWPGLLAFETLRFVLKERRKIRPAVAATSGASEG